MGSVTNNSMWFRLGTGFIRYGDYNYTDYNYYLTDTTTHN
jgi:hypothetical protein